MIRVRSGLGDIGDSQRVCTMNLGCVLENTFRLWERSRGRNMGKVLAILGDRHGGDLTLQVGDLAI